MKAEQYILKYMSEHEVSNEKVKRETGIDMAGIIDSKNELLADDFLKLCIYLGITPEEISDQIL